MLLSIQCICAPIKENIIKGIPEAKRVFSNFFFEYRSKFIEEFENRTPMSEKEYAKAKKAAIAEIKKGNSEGGMASLMFAAGKMPEKNAFKEILSFAEFIPANVPYDIRHKIEALSVIAYEIALTKEEKAAALLFAAKFAQGSDDDKYLLYRAANKILPISQIKAKYPGLKDAAVFELKGISVTDDPSKITIRFSLPLKRKHNENPVDPRDFVTISPNSNITMHTSNDTIEITGVTPGEKYKIRIDKYLCSDGEPLGKNHIETVNVGDKPPAVNFPSQNAYILLEDSSQVIPIEYINVKEVEFSLFKASDRTMPFLAYRNYREELIRINSVKLYQETKKVPCPLNKKHQEGLCIKNILEKNNKKSLAPGVYFLTAKVKGFHLQGTITPSVQMIVVTNMAICAMQTKSGLSVHVRDLKTAELKKNVKVQLVAKNLSVLAEGVTDKNGFIKFDPGVLQGNEEGLLLSSLFAFSGSDFAYLEIDAAKLDMSGYDIEGIKKAYPISCFLYTDRGIYRPGETVNISGILRDENFHAAQDVPVTIKIKKPDGSEMTILHAKSNKVGMFAHKLELSKIFMLGTWQIAVYTDVTSSPLYTSSFQIAEFVSPKIEIDLYGDKNISENGKANVNVKGKHVFGAPAQNLNAECETKLVIDDNPFGMEGYFFRDESADLTEQEKDSSFPTIVVPLGKSDVNGEIKTQVDCPEIPGDRNEPFLASIKINFFDPGGRAVSKSKVVPVIRNGKKYIAIKPFFEKKMSSAKEASFHVLLLDQNGDPIKSTLEYELLEERPNYIWEKPNYGQLQYKYDPELIPVRKGKVAVYSNNPNKKFVVTGLAPGTYFLKLSGHGTKTSFRFFVGYQDGKTPQCPTAFPIKLDKESYKPGETIHASIDSPFKGKAILRAVNDKVISSEAMDLNSGKSSIDIPVNKNFGPGAYIIVSAYRPIDPIKKSPAPKRAIAMVFAKVHGNETKFDLQIDSPKESAPESTVNITIKSNAKEAYATVSIVDEGVLSITKFDTPNPYEYFSKKPTFDAIVYDAYGKIIDPYQGNVTNFGGDGFYIPMSSFRPYIKTFALFSGIVQIKNGTCTIPFYFPEFNGKARIMVACASNNGTGSVSKEIMVRDPVVFTIYTPRFLSYGDKAQFIAQEDVIKKTDEKHQVHILEHKKYPTTMSNGVVNVTIPSDTTESKYDLKAKIKSGKKEYTRSFMVPLYSPSIQKSSFELVKIDAHAKKKVPIALSGQNQQITVEARGGFGFHVTQLWNELSQYQFMCLEQMLSKAWPLIYSTELSKLIGGPTLNKGLLHEAMQKIILNQDISGEFSAWNHSSKPDEYLTICAADLLITADLSGAHMPQFCKDRLLLIAKNKTERRRWNSGRWNSENNIEMSSYEIYVFSMMDCLSLVDIRSFAKTNFENKNKIDCNTLSAIYIAHALAYLGDNESAKEMLRQINPEKIIKSKYISKFASIAMATRLLSDMTKIGGVEKEATELLGKTISLLSSEYTKNAKKLNTMEKSLLLCVAAKIESPKPNGDARIKITGAHNKEIAHGDSCKFDVSKPCNITVENKSDQPVFACVTSSWKDNCEKPSSNGIKISREFFSINGEKMTSSEINRGDVVCEVIECEISSPNPDQDTKLVIIDRPAAGFEVLSNAAKCDWLSGISKPDQRHVLDNFTAFFVTIKPGEQKTKIACLLRAVTSGEFTLPPASVEDMYNPNIFANTVNGKIKIKTCRVNYFLYSCM